MKLSECVSTADIGTLRKIAKHYGFSCSLHSKHALLQEILFAFQSRKFLNEQVDAWRLRWLSVHVRLCLSERNLFSVEEIHALFHVDNQNSEELQSAISEGWIFPVHLSHGRDSYAVPEEFMRVMKERLVGEWSEKVRVSEEGPLTFREEEYALSRDLDVFLEYVMHHEVQLTTGGAMYKRYLQQILELIEVEERPVDGGWRFGYGRRIHDYPDRFALLYDYAYFNRLIEESETGLLRITDDAAEWRTIELQEKQRRLVQFYISLYRRPIPRLPQIIRMIAVMTTEWVESNSMLEALKSLINKFYYDEVTDVWNTRIIKMLMHLGLLRVGEDESQTTWFQITKLGQELLTKDATLKQTEEGNEQQRILIVQPNFDIMVTADQPLITLELAKFTELKEAGAIRLYRLSEESVRKGLTAGHTLIPWMSYISKHSQNPIPGNVERMLHEWEAAFRGPMDSLTS